MPITVQPVPMLSDNYAWLLRCSATGAVAIVDPPDAEAAERAIEAAGGRLDMILLTHHHGDHTAGADTLRARHGCPVVGAKADAHRLPRLDRAVAEGDQVKFGAASALVIDTPGHTRGHVSFFIEDGGILLCGDTLFSLGCGRLLEGNAAEMFASLGKLARLPRDTLVCCGHEYTESNARFAVTVEPENEALARRATEVRQLRAQGRPTVPSRLGDEMDENPFLRAPSSKNLAEMRIAKDNF